MRNKSKIPYNRSVALAIPCLNEEKTISDVIKNSRSQIEDINVYVFDNGSSDNSIKISENSGAKVVRVSKLGKGHVVHEILSTLSEDFIIIVDGDNTYDVTNINAHIKEMIEEEIDMIIGHRQYASCYSHSKTRRFGNYLISSLFNLLFGQDYSDILSGYRIVNQRAAKLTLPKTSGFEVETLWTYNSSQSDIKICERVINYITRPEGSNSKLSVLKDGCRISKLMMKLFLFGNETQSKEKAIEVSQREN